MHAWGAKWRGIKWRGFKMFWNLINSDVSIHWFFRLLLLFIIQGIECKICISLNSIQIAITRNMLMGSVKRVQFYPLLSSTLPKLFNFLVTKSHNVKSFSRCIPFEARPLKARLRRESTVVTKYVFQERLFSYFKKEKKRRVSYLRRTVEKWILNKFLK